MFAGVMAVLLAGLIAFVYFHFRSDLDYNIDGSLHARAQEVASLVRNENAADTRGALGTIPDQGENFVQVLDDAGRVLGASPGHASPPLLAGAEIRGGRALAAADRARQPLPAVRDAGPRRRADRRRRRVAGDP